MAEAPSYDANRFPTVSAKFERNHAVSDFFEPGSVFKVVTIAGALSEHLVTPQTRFTLPYSIQVADRRIHDAELRGTETMTVAQILQRSSNVGTVTIAKTLLGESRLKRWIKQFGFGETTGIDFPGESPGLLPSYWSGSTIGNVPIGQGISVTAIQLASVYAAIANKGVWVQPHLVDHLQGEKPPAPRARRILSRGVDHTLSADAEGCRLRRRAPLPAPRSPATRSPARRAPRRNRDRTAMSPGSTSPRSSAWCPRTTRACVVLVTVDEPHRAIFGGIVAAPAFAQIAGFDLQYLAVPPDLKVR